VKEGGWTVCKIFLDRKVINGSKSALKKSLLGGTVKCDRPIAEGRLCSFGRGRKKTSNTLVTSAARHQSSFTVRSLIDEFSRR